MDTTLSPLLPYIPEARAGSLTAHPGRPVWVVIEPWPGMAAGDEAWLYWTGSQFGGSLVRLQTVSAAECGQAVMFMVENRYVQANTYGSIQISYLIERANGPALLSGCEIYDVAGLAPPSVDGVQRLRYDLPLMLPLVAPGSTATVRIPGWKDMCVDDQLIVSWRGQQPGTHFVERVSIDTDQLDKEILVHVPESFLRRSVTQAQLIEVQYVLVPAQGQELASPACQPFLVGKLP